MRSRLVLYGAFAVAVAGLAVATVTTVIRTDPQPAAEPDAAAPATSGQPRRESTPDILAQRDGPTLALPADAAAVRIPGARLFGWAMLDRRTGQQAGSANSGTVLNTVESMIKPWIASDYLRRLAEAGRTPAAGTLDELARMIVNSNDPLAEKYFQLGGADAVTKRMVSRCGLARVRILPEKWSWTEMTPRDALAYALCLADGRAAGPQWTDWVLTRMRAVRGGVGDQVSSAVQGGRWGIIEALPPELATETAIKNGWTSYTDGWHVNCLAVHPDWALTVMLRTTRGLAAAASNCRAVAAALLVTP